MMIGRHGRLRIVKLLDGSGGRLCGDGSLFSMFECVYRIERSIRHTGDANHFQVWLGGEIRQCFEVIASTCMIRDVEHNISLMFMA